MRRCALLAEPMSMSLGYMVASAQLLTEWQVSRMFEARRGAWATFQYLVRERLLDEGAAVGADGSVST